MGCEGSKYAQSPSVRGFGVAPRRGFEPQFTAPKAAVLPLDDRGMASQSDSPSSVPVCPPLPQRPLPSPPSPVPFHSSPSSPYRYNEKRKAIWTGVRGGLQNRSAAVEVVGVFDSHCLPPSPPEPSPFPPPLVRHPNIGAEPVMNLSNRTIPHVSCPSRPNSW